MLNALLYDYVIRRKIMKNNKFYDFLYKTIIFHMLKIKITLAEICRVNL